MIVDPNQLQPSAISPPVMGADEIVGHVKRAVGSLPIPVQDAVDHAHGLMGGGEIPPMLARPDQGNASAPPAPIFATPSVPNSPMSQYGDPGFTPPALPSSRQVPERIATLESPQMMAPTGTPPPMALPDARAVPDRMATLESPRMMIPPGADQYAVPPSAAESKLAQMRDSGAGWHGIHNPFLKTLAGVGNVVASGLFPQFGQFIPGTDAKHFVDVQNAESRVGDEQEQQKARDAAANAEANRGHVAAETEESQARATQERARAESLLHPPDPKEWTEGKDPVVDPEHPELGPQSVWFNKNDPSKRIFGGTVGAKPVAEKPSASFHVLPDGKVISTVHDPATGKSKAEVVYEGNPKVKTTITKLKGADGKEHSVLVNADSGDTIKDLGETGEKTPNVNINQGTWSIQEDAEGRPIEYNSKTGETRPIAAGGVQKAGTKEKRDAATEKAVGPSRDALEYAEKYLKMPPTGPGDEALMEKFFELAKPSSGFRMTDSQINMLKHAQSWMGSAAATIHHATVGTWFSDQLRKDIVGTMKQLGDAKMAHVKTSGGGTGDGVSLPAEALKQLKEGHETTFGNGETWTLENGKPKQVSGGK